MTPTQLDAALAKLGLSRVAAAELLDTTDRQIRRWCDGASKYRIDKARARLLRAMIKFNLKPEDVK